MNKSCNLKGQQKLFFLQLNQAASCCRAVPISLSNKTLNQCLEQWQVERDLLAQGNELPGCKHCWQAEHNGQLSYRKQMANNDENFIELYINNLCNQMCGYCSPKFSSTWQDSIQQHGNFVNVSKQVQQNLSIVENKNKEQRWMSELKKYISQGPVSIRLLGGEPLMQKHNLQQLLEFNTDQIQTLSVHTNLNPPNNKFLKWVLENFPQNKLKFVISLDTVPEHNAIPRAGFDRTKFEENLSLLEHYNIPFSFISVVSVLNIFSVAQYQNWLQNKGYQAKFVRLNNPDCLEASYLPDHFKKSIQQDLLPKTAFESLTHTPSMIDLKRFEQYNYLKQYFQRTNTIITDQKLLEYWEWLKENYETSNSIRSSS